MQHHTCALTELCTFTAFPGVIFKLVFLVPEQVGSTTMAASGKTKFHNSVLSDNIDWIRKSLYGETLDLKRCYKQVCIYKHQRPRLWRPVIVIKIRQRNMVPGLGCLQFQAGSSGNILHVDLDTPHLRVLYWLPLSTDSDINTSVLFEKF